MIIPVRVRPGTAVHRVGGTRTFPEDHPLYRERCPVCGGRLGAEPATLIYVGAEPGEGWTASAVAVHESCAGPHGEDAAAMREALRDPLCYLAGQIMGLRASAPDAVEALTGTLDRLAAAAGLTEVVASAVATVDGAGSGGT